MHSWRLIQKQNFKSWQELANYLEIKDRQNILRVSPFPLNLPRRLAEKIEKNNLSDPVLRQFLPTLEEKVLAPQFVADPVGDQEARRGNKLLRKYRGRALLLVSSACAMHCRFCFRQNFDYAPSDTFDAEIEQIAQDFTIKEVILSGGDPLSLSNPALHKLIDQLCSIPHVRKLRFHTRFPIGIPERIDAAFLRMLENCRLQIVFILHVNHVQELDTDILQAMARLQKLGIPVLSHTVLLRGVNDETAILHELFDTLSDHGIMPYYLNQLDRTQGTAHFETPIDKGLRMIEELKASLPGYAVPRYVWELPGRPNKTHLQYVAKKDFILESVRQP